MLDRILKAAKFYPRSCTMSFQRKWMSDTNLSKLLHETIEKKQANKKSKLPDFCKDAILSATIKKISSAMVINRSLPTCGKDGHFMDSDQSNCMGDFEFPFCDGDLLDKDAWADDLDTPMTMNLDRLEADVAMMNGNLTVEVDDRNQTPWRASRPPLCRQSACPSPKRKREPSGDTDNGLTYTNLETVASHSSPRKKRRDEPLENQHSSLEFETFDGIELSGSTWADDAPAEPFTHLSIGHTKGQRSRSLPHLSSLLSKDGTLITSKTNTFTSPKSVVNSISELTIHDCWESAKDGSWCFPRSETEEHDPLELGGFFAELKTVTVHPN